MHENTPNTQGTLKDWGTDAAPWSDHASEITSLDVQRWVHVPSAHGMFSDCAQLAYADVSRLTTSGSTDFGEMFYECSSLRQVNFGRFDTSAATLMSLML